MDFFLDFSFDPQIGDELFGLLDLYRLEAMFFHGYLMIGFEFGQYVLVLAVL